MLKNTNDYLYLVINDIVIPPEHDEALQFATSESSVFCVLSEKPLSLSYLLLFTCLYI